MNTMKDIMYVCIILHNMIVEDEWHTYNDNIDYSYDHLNNSMPTTEVSNDSYFDFETYLKRKAIVLKKKIHQQLLAD